MTTQPITDLDISKAIKSTNNRKSVGADGITDEVIKQNQEWFIPNHKIILHNFQQSYRMPRQWLKGVMTFLPNQRKDREKLTTFASLPSLIWYIKYGKSSCQTGSLHIWDY